jgi:hypothetical protein
MTYVQIRAKTSQKHPKRVLAEMVQETGDLHRRIDATLAGNPNALKSWKTLEYGFMYGPLCFSFSFSLIHFAADGICPLNAINWLSLG